MLNSLNNREFLLGLSIKELEQLSDQIAVFLAYDTHFDVQTIMHNINVLETTIALHRVFDFTQTVLVFDGGSQSLVHQILTGRFQKMTLKHNASPFPDIADAHDWYQGGRLGDGIAVGLALALSTSRKTFVVMDDYALNSGAAYEALLQISKAKANITLIIIDEQLSLLRHYNSLNSFVKSIRISKTYTSIKKDMKSVLGSNKISKPLLTTLTKIRDSLKETVIEPTIFKQFNISYHGPIDGQNFTELLKIIKLSEKFAGPNVIHIQTRLKKKGRRKIELPKHKTINDYPQDYRSYVQKIDEFLVGYQRNNHSLTVLADVTDLNNHCSEFSQSYPESYMTTSGSTQALISMALGSALAQKKVVVLVHSYQFETMISQLNTQFYPSKLPLVILLSDAGLNRDGSVFTQGTRDISLATALGIACYTGKDINETVALVDHALDQPEMTLVRFAGQIERVSDVSKSLTIANSWEFEGEADQQYDGIILTYGQAYMQFQKKIVTNRLNFALINCRLNNQADEAMIAFIKQQKRPVLIYDIDSEVPILLSLLPKLDVAIINYYLERVDLNLSSRNLKMKYHLQIDEVLSNFIDITGK